MLFQRKPRIKIGSLDLFWMPELGDALEPVADCELLSTWSPKKKRKLPLLAKNARALHYALATYKRFPILQHRNLVYLHLCEAFDLWLTKHVDKNIDALYFLSGCGLKAMRKAQGLTLPVVIESGSTHTDFQHEIVWKEYCRNGKKAPLFPEGYRDRVRKEFEEADFIQIPSEFVRRTYLDAGIPETKLLKAAYGADTSAFNARKTSDVLDAFRVICPSGVNLRKGARVLVEAWKKLAWSPKEAELHWIGSPNHPDVDHLFSSAPPGIIWHGWMSQTKLSALYRSCDTLVLPSFEEGLARVLIEASACGLAPIATPNTGVEDFFTQGNPEGWLIPCNDVDALCAALSEARADRNHTFELGQRASTRAREAFSWQNYGEQVRNNFRKIEVHCTN